MKNYLFKIFIAASLAAFGYVSDTFAATNAYDLQVTQRNGANSAWSLINVPSAGGNVTVTDAASLRTVIGAQGALTFPITGAQGGTGVANTGKTITLGGNVTTSGAFNYSLTLTGNTSVTSPTTGTLASATPLPLGYLNQQFVFTGDSLTWGLVSPNTVPYPTAMSARPPLLNAGTSTNYGVAGAGLSYLVTNYSGTVYTKRPAATGATRAVLYVWIGANDFQDFTTNAAAIYVPALESYWQTAKNDGFTVVAFTVMKRIGNISNTNKLAENNRLAINTGIRASTVPDMLVDVDMLFPDPANSTYFLDGTHLNDTANKKLAEAVIGVTMSQGSILTPSPPVQTSYPILPAAAAAVINGAAVTFNSAGTGLVTLAPAVPALGSGAWSVEGWAYAPSTMLSGSVYLIAKSGGSGVGVQFSSTDGWTIFDENAVAKSTNQVYTDCWNHIAVTKSSGGVVTYYLNGAAIGTSTDSTTGTTLDTVNISHSSGAVSRVRVYNREITAAQVLASYNRLGVYDATDTTITYAMADAGTGQSGKLADLASNAANGTLSAGAFLPEGSPITSPLISGPAQVSQWAGSSTFAYFGNKALSTSSSSYAVLQDTSGTTYLNAASGQSMLLGINNSNVGTITSSGLTLASGKSFTMTGNASITGNVSITGNTTLSVALPVSSGGTGQTTYTNGQLLIGNTTGSTLTKATLTAGAGVTVTNGTGSITLTNTGMTALRTGTATLVAGTATVSDASTAATTRIRLSMVTPGGTVGAQYVSAKTNATSFVITSTSALDTSVIYYEAFEP